MLEIKISPMARRTDRRIVNPSLKSVVRVNDQCHDVVIVNISRRGLRFRSSEQYNKGDRLRFELNSCDKTAALSLSIRAKIKNDYESAAGNTYEYGVVFSRLLNWYEMYCIHDFVYSYEKRRAVRVER